MALLNLANNPTLNTSALYALASPISPFQPGQAVAPEDFAVRPNYPSGFTVSPASLSFASQVMGSTSSAQTVTLNNTGNVNRQCDRKLERHIACRSRSERLSAFEWLRRDDNCGSEL